VGWIVSTLLGGIVGELSKAANWVLKQLGAVLTATTQVDLHHAWFSAQWPIVSGIAMALCLVGVLLSAAEVGVFRDPRRLVTAVGHVASSGIGTGCVITVAGLLIALTDSLCQSMIGPDQSLPALDRLETLLTAGSLPASPLLINGFVAVLALGVAFVIWIEMLMRQAAIYLCVFFFPLALAGLSWAPSRAIAARLSRTLVALILSKLVIVGAVSLGVTAIGGGSDHEFNGILVGIVMLVLAAFAPFTLTRLLGLFEDAHGYGVLRGGTAVLHGLYGLSSVVYLANMASRFGHHSGGRAPGPGPDPGQDPDPGDDDDGEGGSGPLPRLKGPGSSGAAGLRVAGGSAFDAAEIFAL
jgi:hypothetical protein